MLSGSEVVVVCLMWLGFGFIGLATLVAVVVEGGGGVAVGSVVRLLWLERRVSGLSGRFLELFLLCLRVGGAAAAAVAVALVLLVLTVVVVVWLPRLLLPPAVVVLTRFAFANTLSRSESIFNKVAEIGDVGSGGAGGGGDGGSS